MATIARTMLKVYPVSPDDDVKSQLSVEQQQIELEVPLRELVVHPLPEVEEQVLATQLKLTPADDPDERVIMQAAHPLVDPVEQFVLVESLQT